MGPRQRPHLRSADTGNSSPPRRWHERHRSPRLTSTVDSEFQSSRIGLEVDDARGRLVAWKPAFGSQLVVAVEATSPVQMVTVRIGVLPARLPRDESSPAVSTVTASPRDRVRVLARTRDDDLDTLATAHAVVGVGRGIDPSEYDDLGAPLEVLRAELGATRKVTDAGWLPRARQIGITGRSIAPRLFVSIGASGKFNHMVGVRVAGTVLAINPDPDALVFGVADIGMVADWHDVSPPSSPPSTNEPAFKSATKSRRSDSPFQAARRIAGSTVRRGVARPSHARRRSSHLRGSRLRAVGSQPRRCWGPPEPRSCGGAPDRIRTRERRSRRASS